MTITRTRWTDEDIQNLLYMKSKGMEVKFMAKMLGRTEKAIEARLYLLGHGVKPVATPEQLTLEPEKPVVTAKPAPKEAKPTEVYVLIRRAKPSFIERIRCYLNGTEWKKTAELIKE